MLRQTRLLANRAHLFVFVTKPGRAVYEQHLHPSVIFRKVTNGFRCEWGAETYAAFRSVVSTAKANRASVLDTIRFVLAAKLPAGPIAGAGVSNYERWLSGDDYTFINII